MTSASWPLESILEPVRRYWGFDRLRPMQEQAIRAGLERRDSIVVMPTGGGKSLCYQVPAVLAERTDVVVSPLIALMKDQVDGLRACGYPAVAIHSGMPADEVARAESEIAAGNCRLVFLAPERLMSGRCLELLDRIGVRAFAIDEAHCISHWGHDFRKEYRKLALLKQRFPQASIHAFTATATARVREDIVTQLGLQDARILVGSFDRPNLVYRVIPRVDGFQQVADAVRRHERQAVIVYCLSRKDTEAMAESLRAGGVQAEHYHAGMQPDPRRRTQDAFAQEKLDVIVATVAFGMGIDRSDVRAVIHATMPKSVEHYQQETGRAGRDGLEAECVLFYSGADVMRWQSLFERSADRAGLAPETTQPQLALLHEMQRFSGVPACRHRALVEYFGQTYEQENCGACDVCLDEVEGYADATETAQKILSCVARVDERFGAGHVTDVLLGSNSERVLKLRHHQLSTHGLLKGTDKKALTNMIYQLIDQRLLERSDGEYPVLNLNAASWEVLRGQRTVRLMQPKSAPLKKTRFDEESWEGVDRGLFESLRALRREIAEERGVPAYVIFGDATLRDMARVRPTTKESFLAVRGIGEKKLADLGAVFGTRIVDYCREHKLDCDVSESTPGAAPPAAKRVNRSPAKLEAFELFAAGRPVEEVMASLGRARSTTLGYLAEFVEAQKPERLDAWLAPQTYRAIAQAIDEVGSAYLKPIFEQLGGAVPYEDIRLVKSHLAYHRSETNSDSRERRAN